MGLLSPPERRSLEGARVGRLATADGEARPHVVPFCFALDGETVVTPIDEKPKRGRPSDLRRVRDIRENQRVAMVVDHWSEDWERLGWLQLRGTAVLIEPEEPGHAAAVVALRTKYDQYRTHALEERPIIRIQPGSVLAWGQLERA